MKIIVLQAGKKDPVLEELLAKIQVVLEELQVDVKYINLNQIPYYNGNQDTVVKGVLDDIKSASGVIMTSRVELLSVSGSLCSFFEHCTLYKGDSLFNKPLFALTASEWRGEREAAEYMLHAWDILGGTEYAKLSIYIPAYYNNKDDILTNVERMAEGFYRIIKQKRLPAQGSDYISFSSDNDIKFDSVLEKIVEKEVESYSPVKIQKSPQEKDIEDLANFFKNKLNQEESQDAFVPAPGIKSTKQLIRNLPHYFQGQHAVDFNAVIQYHVLLEETLSGHLTIENGNCLYSEGVYPEAEIELTAEEEVFQKIFSKEITSQKAFMLGQLKVRGNFMLLAKLDQMFKKM